MRRCLLVCFFVLFAQVNAQAGVKGRNACFCQAAKADAMTMYGPRCHTPQTTKEVGSFVVDVPWDPDHDFGKGWKVVNNQVQSTDGKWVCDPGIPLVLVKCGDGKKAGTEECDGTDFGNTTCLTVGGSFVGGTLSCSRICSVITTGCKRATCGDGFVNQIKEQCDGTALNGGTCAGLPGMAGGVLTCTSTCQYNTSQCITKPSCGDGTVDNGEQCDGSVNTTCLLIPGGFSGGFLKCGSDCKYDTTGCINVTCGDNKKNQFTEQCDGTDLNSKTCTSWPTMYTGGTLKCDATCKFDKSQCIASPKCGNGKVEAGEQCERGVTITKNCSAVDPSMVGGALECNKDCTFNTTRCVQTDQCCKADIAKLGALIDKMVRLVTPAPVCCTNDIKPAMDALAQTQLLVKGLMAP